MYLTTLGGLRTAPVHLIPLKQRLLLAYLAVSGPTDRAALREWLWPHVAHPAANLRMALMAIDSALPGAVHKRARTLELIIPSDLAALRVAMAQLHQPQVLSLYRGGFLADVKLPAELEGLARWVEHTRRDIADQYRAALMELAGRHARNQRPGEAGRLIERIIQVDGASALRADDIERLAQLVGQRPPTTPTDSAPLVARDLPRPQAMFVGREALVKALTGRLCAGSEPLITLLGPAGMGKTRLAIEVARRLAGPGHDFCVAYVPLDALTQPDRLLHAIALAFNIVPMPNTSVFELVSRRIGRQQAVVVLDAFEHLTAAAQEVSRLLSACPNLRVLVTSRVRLRLPGEAVVPVEGLAVSVESGRSEAVQLFVARARRVRPTFLPTATDIKRVERITALLDGSPLGIELAATWMWTLTLAQVEGALLGPDPLGGLGRDVGRTEALLDDVLSRSWSLLSAGEQRVLRASAALPGGFTSEAAQDVLGADAPLLAGLIDRSLLRVDDAGRFSQHSLLLAYSAARAQRDPTEHEAVEVRCADHFLEWIEPLFLRLRQQEGAALLVQLDTEMANIRHVFAWAAETQHMDVILRLGTSLFFYWWFRGSDDSVLEWLQRALEESTVADETRARALWALGTLLVRGERWAEAARWLEECLALSRTLELVEWEANALLNLGTAAIRRGALEEAALDYQDSLRLYRSLDHSGSVTALLCLGRTDQVLGRMDQARSWYEQGLQATETFDNRQDQVRLLRYLAEWWVVQGDASQGRGLLERGLQYAQEFGMETELPHFLDGFAALHAAQEAQAARLWGAWSSRTRAIGAESAVLDEHTFQRLRERVRASLGDPAFQEQWQQGEQLTLEQALSEASAPGPPETAAVLDD